MRAKFIVLYALLLVLLAACLWVHPAVSMSESGVNMRWPDTVMGFTGKEEPVSESERILLPADTEFAKKSFTRANGERVDAQIVLSGVERRSIHRPEICLRGQGWNVRSGEVVPVPLKSGHVLDIMVLDITRPVHLDSGSTVDLPALYAYFFVSKDAQTPKHLDRIAITNLDLLLHNKAHRWAYVIVMAQVTKGFIPGGRDRAETLDLIKEFLRDAAPEFLKSEMPAATGARKSPALTAGGS